MVRTIITPDDTHVQLDIPEEYVGKKVEVTVLSLDELEPKHVQTMGQFWGILSDATADEIRKHIDLSRDEWERDI